MQKLIQHFKWYTRVELKAVIEIGGSRLLGEQKLVFFKRTKSWNIYRIKVVTQSLMRNSTPKMLLSSSLFAVSDATNMEYEHVHHCSVPYSLESLWDLNDPHTQSVDLRKNHLPSLDCSHIRVTFHQLGGFLA